MPRIGSKSEYVNKQIAYENEHYTVVVDTPRYKEFEGFDTCYQAINRETGVIECEEISLPRVMIFVDSCVTYLTSRLGLNGTTTEETDEDEGEGNSELH